MFRAAGFCLASLLAFGSPATPLYSQSERSDAVDVTQLEATLRRSVEAAPFAAIETPDARNAAAPVVRSRSSAALRELGRLHAPLPQEWQSSQQNRTAVWSAPSIPGAQLHVPEPSDPTSVSAAAFLKTGLDQMEAGRQTLRVYPEQPRAGRTRNGLPLAFQSRASRGSRGDLRYTAVYAFPAGARFQAVLAIAENPESFQKILNAMQQALDDPRTRIELPQNGAQPARGAERGFLVYRMQQPSDWKLSGSPYASNEIYEFTRLPGQSRVFPGEKMRVTYELQAGNPTSPLHALERFLLQRSGLAYHGHFENAPMIRTEMDEGRLNNGLHYAGMAIEQQRDGDDRFFLGGYVIQGPGFSLLMATGMKYYRYDMIKRGSTAREDFAEWRQFRRNLRSLAETIEWDTQSLERDANAETWLAQRGRLRYHRESSLISGDLSFVASRSVSWDFLQNGGVRYASESFRGFNATETTSSGGLSVSSGYAGGSAAADGARYVVLRKDGRRVLFVQHASGLTSFHRLALTPRFIIDGYVDGCCQ